MLIFFVVIQNVLPTSKLRLKSLMQCPFCWSPNGALKLQPWPAITPQGLAWRQWRHDSLGHPWRTGRVELTWNHLQKLYSIFSSEGNHKLSSLKFERYWCTKIRPDQSSRMCPCPELNQYSNFGSFVFPPFPGYQSFPVEMVSTYQHHQFLKVGMPKLGSSLDDPFSQSSPVGQPANPSLPCRGSRSPA